MSWRAPVGKNNEGAEMLSNLPQPVRVLRGCTGFRVIVEHQEHIKLLLDICKILRKNEYVTISNILKSTDFFKSPTTLKHVFKVNLIHQNKVVALVLWK